MPMRRRAIDVHVHPGTPEFLQGSMGHFAEAAVKYFHKEVRAKSEEEMAREFRDADVFGVLLAWNATSGTNLPPVTNEYVASVVDRFPDDFIGFASVDPWGGRRSVAELRHAIEELGLKGAKFQQIAMAFRPSDRRFRPLWELCSELKVPVLFHCGMTGLGAGLPGGGGLKLDYGRPIYIDSVAAEFPKLTIIGAHPAWPWQSEMIAIALHKANVYIDLSGWSPKYFPDELKREIGTRLQDKVLFGTDYPYLAPGRWLDDFERLGYAPAVVEKVLRANAARVLGLDLEC
jgi:predicted TIM-barrel fold metal-dependent hydrolase